MDCLRVPPLLVFAAVSAVAHAGVFAAATRHASKSSATLEFDPTTQALAGDTLDVDPPAPDPGEDQVDEAEPPAASPPTPGAASAPPRPAARATHADCTPGTHAPSGGAPPALFGAVGVRFATDLATTFTRAFPQAASADPVWSTASFGNAGTADVTLLLDDAGHLAGSSIKGSPSQALRRGIERTLALLGPRAFTAHGAATHLRIGAHVGRDEVHDGLHGEVFALSGGSFSGDLGTAFFALPASGGGRRIDVELKLLP